MKIIVKQQKPTKVEVFRTGATGKSAYQIWLDAGNMGSIAEFLARDIRTYSYINSINAIFTHNLGKHVIVQAIDTNGNTHYPDVVRINLNQVQIITNIPKTLTIIVQ